MDFQSMHNHQYQMNNDTPTPFFLFLGSCDHEGATSKLKAAGFTYKKKMLESQVSNWESIFTIIADENLIGVLLKMTHDSYVRVAQPEYAGPARTLFSALKKVPHIVFVHETLLTGVYNEAPEDDHDFRWERHYFGPLDEVARKHGNALMEEYDLSVVPYVKNAELTTMALTFIDQNEKNLIFRVYVPEGRIWSMETEKVLHLFRDYLAKVSGLKVRQDQYRTNKGTVYEFFSDHILEPMTLPAEFNDFSRFLDLCMTEPESAARLLEEKNVSSRVIHEILDRYAKEAKRLHVDLKQERERKLLSIRHRMESELIDVVPTGADWAPLNQFIDSLVPNVEGVSSALGFDTPQASRVLPTQVTLNYKPQIINRVQGFVAQEVSGTQNFGTNANNLIRLINEHAGLRKVELISAVHEIEDADANSGDRLTAAQKLKSFVFKVGEKVADVGFGVLTSYIEKQVGL